LVGQDFYIVEVAVVVEDLHLEAGVEILFYVFTGLDDDVES
jgi:hypothetical protein